MHQPMVYRLHRFGDDLQQSSFVKVQEPVTDKKEVHPHILIAPVLGFVNDCYRLGYGNGLYDRTV